MDEGAILPDVEVDANTELVEPRRDLLAPHLLPISFSVDSMDEFKPMMCGDNGFASATVQELGKTATHIVIQHDPCASSAISAANTSWAEAAAMSVLPVRCKNTSAEFHKAKFGSGSRGKCIRAGDNWYTPMEFESLCGRGSSKDWKRSIRFGGHSIQTLIDENAIAVHATSCTCAICCDDLSVAGPVRYFVRNKRRRRAYWNCECTNKNKKKNKSSSADDSDDKPHQCYRSLAVKKEEAWKSITVGLGADEDIEDPDDSSDEALLRDLDDLDEKTSKLFEELQKSISQAEKIVAKFTRRREREALASSSTSELAKEESTPFKKCVNCGREATAECSLCRQTPYCSTFCQRRDWNAHQEKCVRVMVIV